MCVHSTDIDDTIRHSEITYSKNCKNHCLPNTGVFVKWKKDVFDESEDAIVGISGLAESPLQLLCHRFAAVEKIDFRVFLRRTHLSTRQSRN